MRTIVLAYLLASVSSSALADVVYVVRPDIPRMAAGVLPPQAFASTANTSPVDTGNSEWTSDWSEVPRDAEGFIYKSPGYGTTLGTISSAPIRFSVTDADRAGGKGAMFSSYNVKADSGAYFIRPLQSGERPYDISELAPCMFKVAPYLGGPKNLTIGGGFQVDYNVRKASIHTNMDIRYSQNLKEPVKVGIRLDCRTNTRALSVNFLQDIEITYTPPAVR